MSHSLAVRHRPRRFAEVAGQVSSVDVLSAAAGTDPAPQQVLLAGPSGVGKTTLARVYAAALFCPNTVARPEAGPAGRDACGECTVCRQVTGPGGQHPDVIELDAASNGGVDQVRSWVDQAHLAPLVGQYRIYIVDEAHGLTREGGQAFLKLLEEPPSHTLFILATTDPQKLPGPLRGRCVELYVTAPESEDLVANLQRVCDAEGWQVPQEVLQLVVDATDSDLGVRGTVTTLSKLASDLPGGVSVEAAARRLGVTDPAVFSRLVSSIEEGSRPAALAATATALSQGAEALLLNRLRRWAHLELRQAVEAGRDEAAPLWWVTQLADPEPWPLLVRVARMCEPALAGVEGLHLLVERAEALADKLSNAGASGAPSSPSAAPRAAAPRQAAPPSPAPSPTPPTPPPSSPPALAGAATGVAADAVPDPAPVQEGPDLFTAPVSAERSSPAAADQAAAGQAPAAASTGAEVDPIAFVNRVSKLGGGLAALAMRRGTIDVVDGALRVTAADPSGRVAAAVAAAAAELGCVVDFVATP